MIQMKTIENIDRRVLGALRFIDRVTGTHVKRSMNITSSDLKFMTNRSYLHVISYAKDLESHLNVFDAPPGVPDISSVKFNITVTDPHGQYLSRLVSLGLPRSPDPENANSLFNPIDVPLFASPAAHLSPNWSIIRCSVFDVANNKAISGALLRITDSNNDLMMSGISDKRGEAVIMIPGIPISNFAQGIEPPPDDPVDPGLEEEDDSFASGPVIETETPVKLNVVTSPDAPWPADPEKMEQNHITWRRKFKIIKNDPLVTKLDLKLITGKTQSVRLYVDLTEEE